MRRAEIASKQAVYTLGKVPMTPGRVVPPVVWADVADGRVTPTADAALVLMVLHLSVHQLDTARGPFDLHLQNPVNGKLSLAAGDV
jgi:hypothetical protein